jgi:hypothetical protein
MFIVEIYIHIYLHLHTHILYSVSGVEFVATPRSVVIPPRTDGIAVELSITPLAEGVLKVTRRHFTLLRLLLLLSICFVLSYLT